LGAQKVFWAQEEENKGEWMDLHKREDHLTRVIEWKMMIFAGHVSCMREN